MTRLWLDGALPFLVKGCGFADGRIGFECHPPKREAKFLCKTDKRRCHVGPHDRGRDQKSVFAFAFAGIADEVCKTRLVGAKAFAGHMMAHQWSTSMADA